MSTPYTLRFLRRSVPPLSVVAPSVGETSFSTTFPVTENPITGGWTRGLVDGLDWTNPQSGSGRAYGTQTAHAAPPFDDSLAHRSGYPANHFCSGVTFQVGDVGNLEVELLLRFSISAHVARGYEIDIVSDGTLNIVNWLGPLNSFTVLDTSAPSTTNGDTWYAQIVGTVITVKKNGTTVRTYDTAGDAVKWSDGNPGLGFYTLSAVSANDTFGWDSWQAGSL